MEKSARLRNLLIDVKLSEGLNSSAMSRSEAKEKFKVNLKSVHQKSEATHPSNTSRANSFLVRFICGTENMPLYARFLLYGTWRSHSFSWAGGRHVPFFPDVRCRDPRCLCCNRSACFLHIPGYVPRCRYRHGSFRRTYPHR